MINHKIIPNNINKKGDARMEFDELFKQRSIVALNLKDCIRDKGYTKVSFATKADISQQALEEMLNGTINHKTAFDNHLQKILEVLNMTVEELILYHSTTATMHTRNVSMNDQAMEQYDLLLDIIDLCAIYY